MSMRIVSALMAIVLAPATAFASLGGSASTVDEDRVHMKSALTRIVRVDQYTFHELQSASGVTVREYVSSTGTVFAVAWQGPWMPDLQQVLGPYYERYKQAVTAAKQARRGRGPVFIQDGDLVLQVTGHQRAFTGRAYIPGLVPQGVQPETLR